MIRIPNPFRTPSPQELMARELDQAQRGLLEAHGAREYADAMVTYHTKRIERLKATMAGEGV
jgi:hypothetical protein